MPQVVATVANYVVAIWNTAVAGTTIGAIVQSVATIAVTSYAASQLAPKPDLGSLTTGSPLQLARNPAPNRRVIYGQTRCSGPMAFAHLVDGGNPNEGLFLVVLLAGHEVDQIHQLLWVNDVPVRFVGNAAQGSFNGNLFMWAHRGEAAQTANGALIAEAPGYWTSDHILAGNAYLLFKLITNQEDFPGGLPNLAALVRGRRVYDPRDAGQDPDDDSTWLWSDNPALCILDYLTNADFGLGADYAEDIDEDSFVAAANICDETVSLANPVTRTADPVNGAHYIAVSSAAGLYGGLTVSGTGIPAGARVAAVDLVNNFVYLDQPCSASGTGVTLTFGGSERRYRLGGVFEPQGVEPLKVLQHMVDTMAGVLANPGDKWRLYAGAWRAPDVTLNRRDLRAGLSLRAGDPIAATINGVRGTFSFPADLYQPREYPAVTNSAYLTADAGFEHWLTLDLPWVQSPGQAQRLAKIALERARRDRSLRLPCKFTAYRAQSGDMAAIDLSAPYGLSSDPYLVQELKPVIDDRGAIGCDLELREDAAESYVWDPETDERAVAPAPETLLPGSYAGLQ